MNNKVSIELTSGDGTIRNFEFDSDRQFRLLWFDKGGTHVYGKLPLKVIRKHSKEWAETWAAAHVTEMEAYLKHHLPGAIPEELINALKEAKYDRTGLSGLEHENRDDLVASYIVRELLRAVLIRIKKAMEKTLTIWEFPNPQFDGRESNSILDWLFRRR